MRDHAKRRLRVWGTILLVGLAARESSRADDELSIGPADSRGFYTILANINDENGNGVPDYADLENPDEQNIRAIKIAFRDYRGNDTWEYRCLYPEKVGFFILNGASYQVPAANAWAGKVVGNRGYRDYRAIRSNATVRIWRKHPRLSRSPSDILKVELADDSPPGGVDHTAYVLNSTNLYTMAELGLANTGGVLTLWVEGLNRGDVDLNVVSFHQDRGCDGAVWIPGWWSGYNPAGGGAGNSYFSFVTTGRQHRIHVAEVDLGINCNDDMDDADGLRVGVPDVPWVINDDDEAIEEQKPGMPFWITPTFRGEQTLYGLIDCMPVFVNDRSDLRNRGVLFYARERSGGKPLRMHPYANWQSPGADPLLYLKSDAVAKAQFSRWEDTEFDVGRDPVQLPVNHFHNRFLLRAHADSRGENTVDLLVKFPHSDEMQVADTVKIHYRGEHDLMTINSLWDVGSQPYEYPLDGARSQTIDAFRDSRVIQNRNGGVDTTRRNYQVFIHGYATDYTNGIGQSFTTYRCMYWTGYRGNFIGFLWPGDQGSGLKNFDIPVRDALRAAPSLKRVLKESMAAYGTNPQRVNLMAHSLGNLVSIEALRLLQHETPGQVYLRSFTAVEPAVSESMFWPVEDLSIRYFPHGIIAEEPRTVTVDQLMRVSRAFWVNEPGRESYRSAGTWIHSWNQWDYALLAFAVNDLARREFYRNALGDGLRPENPQWPDQLRVASCGTDICPSNVVDFVFRALPLPMPGSKVRLQERSGAINYNAEIAQGRKPMPSGGTYAQAVNVRAKDYGWHPKSHSGFILGDGIATWLSGPTDASLGQVWRWYEHIQRLGAYKIGEE